MIYTFCNYLQINRGLSSNTVEAYRQALSEFASFINDNHRGTRWSTVSKPMIDEYVAMMVNDGYASASIKQHISALRTFYKTCAALYDQGSVHNPARYVSTPKIGEHLPKVIETEAIRKALDNSTTPAQAKAAIAIIYETGLRLSELLELKASDIDNKTQSIRVHGKGNKERTVYYGELTKKYGRCWNGSQHTQRGVRHLVYEALRPYSKAEQLSPHALRHTYASQLVNNGMSVETISKLLGHEHLETTEIYAKLTNKTTRDAYLKFIPKA